MSAQRCSDGAQECSEGVQNVLKSAQKVLKRALKVVRSSDGDQEVLKRFPGVLRRC